MLAQWWPLLVVATATIIAAGLNLLASSKTRGDVDVSRKQIAILTDAYNEKSAAAFTRDGIVSELRAENERLRRELRGLTE